MNQTLAIIGAGAWGSALSIACAPNFAKILLVCHNEKQQRELSQQGHPVLKVPYPNNVQLITDYSALDNVDGVLIATPSSAFNEVLDALQTTKSTHIAWATKGFSNAQLLHQVFSTHFPHIAPCAISGPSFATEVAQHQPTALVVASKDIAQQQFWSQALNSNALRTYTADDIIGVEIGGAVKNVLAIAAGIATGLGFGTNTLSALVTRGLAEMSRLGVALGADEKTFRGLSGLGDLTLTCFDDTSRNRSFGKLIALNNDINAATQHIGATVEGIKALAVVRDMAHTHQVQMPICEQIYQITQGNIDAKKAIVSLMSRNITHE